MNKCAYLTTIALVLLIGTSSAISATTYSYRSPTYAKDQVQNDGKVKYTTKMRINVSFTLAKPLGTNLSDEKFDGAKDIVTWSYSDGIHRYTPTDDAQFGVVLSTDKDGKIIKFLLVGMAPKAPIAAGQHINLITVEDANDGNPAVSAISDVECKSAVVVGRFCGTFDMNDPTSSTAGVNPPIGSITVAPGK